MPAHERFGPDDREPDPALHLTPQDDQLMSERRILCLKPTLRLEWRSHESKQ
jgi:hypothetical protein